MISTNEAKKLIEKATLVGACKNVELVRALGSLLTKDIVSPIDLPQFDQSAMDGYAVKLGKGLAFEIVGEIQAGDNAEGFFLKENQAVKIFTGAMCPGTADLVCRIEDVNEVSESKMEILTLPKMGANIRRCGEQIKKGDFALPQSHKVSPASIGFLANLGIHEVEVYSAPRVALLSTGNELVPAGEVLELGKIYESNAVMLQAALKEVGISDMETRKSVDTLDETISCIRALLEKSDILIITGGISVGDYDFVAEALNENGVEQVFHKVSQKPGKPFYFGKKEGKLIFALPGNPAAVLTCYYQYVLPVINKFQGKEFIGLKPQYFFSESSISRTNAREQFLKAKYFGNKVEILEGQSSAMLHTFTSANALVYVPENTRVEVGDEVLVYVMR